MDELKNALEELQKTLDAHSELELPTDRESFDVWHNSSRDVTANQAIVLEKLNKLKVDDPDSYYQQRPDM
jgi:hypothetical protein